MVLRIRVSQAEFQAAAADGWVDGLFLGRDGLCTYVELGEEKQYLPRPHDDHRTSYRLFTKCDVYFARSQRQLERGDYRKLA